MSTTLFPCDNGSFVMDGPYVDDTGAGRLTRLMTAYFGQMRVSVTGTACTLTYYCTDNSQPVTLVIDGVTSTFTPVQDAWTTRTLWTGSTDTAHDLVVRVYAGGSLYLDRGVTGTIGVTGAAPAVAVPAGSTYSGRLVAYTDLHLGSPTTARDGLTEFGSSAGYPYLAYSYTGGFYGLGAYRFRAACSSFQVWGYIGATSKWRVCIDGSPQTPFTVPASGVPSWGFFPAVTGLDSSAVHEYWLISDDQVDYHQIYEVYLTGGAGFDGVRFPLVRPVVAGMGDSIMGGAATTPTGGYFAAFAWARGAAAVNAGISGSTVAGASSPMQGRTGVITQFGADVSEIVFSGGVNDIINAVSVGDYGTAYASVIASLLAGCPNAKIWCLGLLPNNYGSTTPVQIATFNAAALAAVTAAASARVKFIDPTGWVTSLAPGGDYGRYYAADGLHPNAQGHTLVYSLLEADIRAASGGLIVPGSGFTGGYGE